MGIQSNNETAKFAKNTVERLESAVKSDDKAAYDKTMNEVNGFRAAHTPEQMNAYVANVSQKLQDDHVLPQVSLYETKNNFQNIDITGDGTLQPGEIRAFKNWRGVNELQQALLDPVISRHSQISNYKWDSWHWGDTSISKSDLDEGLKGTQALNNLFTKNADGDSLYMRLKNHNGNISGGKLDAFLKMDAENPASLKLTEQDKQTIHFLKDNRPIGQCLPGTDDLKQANLQQICQKFAVDFDARNKESESVSKDPVINKAYADGKRKAQIELEAAEKAASTRKTDGAHEPDGTRRHEEAHKLESGHKANLTGTKTDDDIKRALTVGKDESYAQCAERLLMLAGNDPTGAEIRHLAHQLRAAAHNIPAHNDQILETSSEIRSSHALAALFARK